MTYYDQAVRGFEFSKKNTAKLINLLKTIAKLEQQQEQKRILKIIDELLKSGIVETYTIRTLKRLKQKIKGGKK